jgi:DNA-binding NtrC family response regulator
MPDTKGTVLLVDDEANTLKVLSAILRKDGYEVTTATTAEDALGRLLALDADAAVVDYRLPGMTGLDFVQALKRDGRALPVIVLTAYGTIEKAVEAMRAGAFMYLAKPVNPDQLLTVTREAVEKRRLVRENASLKNRLEERWGFRNIIGRSPAIRETFDLVQTVARSASSILVMGESGTGKELVARAIHLESPRAGGPFITLDCASLPEETLESEIFGHEKGSFTGAHERKIGQIELAGGGTLFMDEVAELSLNVQKKFLRFLQEREFLRIGGTQRIKVDVRIIAATNRELRDEVQRGNFREDLFYRLNVVVVRVPPLRDRREDVPLLVDRFLERFNAENHKLVAGLDRAAMAAILKHDWPGNVRELENAMERAVVLCAGDTITLQHLPRSLQGERAPRTDREPSPADRSAAPGLFEAERRLLLEALEKAGWNQTRTAEALGISRKQLRTRMRNHDLVRPPGR